MNGWTNKTRIDVKFGFREYFVWFQWYLVAFFMGMFYMPFAIIRNPLKVLRKNHMFVAFWFTLILDFILKKYYSYVLANGKSISVIDGFLSLTLVHNPGAAFGLLKGKVFLFVLIALVTGVVILVYLAMYRQEEPLVSWGLVLILSGAVGNMIDRVQYNYVIDYVLIYYKDWSWPVFNLADVVINVGVGLIILDLVKDWKYRKYEGKSVSGSN